MPESISLKLPLLVAEQAQKHVTHNEALRALDAIVQLSVKDRDLAAPPGSPAEGDRYIVAASPTGAWTGHAADIAVWQDGAWDFHDPREGWRSWVDDENVFLIFNGSAWVDWGAALGALQNLALLGIGTTADATNPFSAKLNKALWTAKYAAEGGDGDLRYGMNKEAAGDVLSLLMQRGFSGRAEIGLIGDDDLLFKVSPDGSAWHEGLRIDKDTGEVTFPNTSIAGGGRELLNTTRTYYVRTDGSDSNDGLANTSGGAFLTIQKALDIVFGTLDLGGFDVTIHVADGTYTGGNAVSAPQVGKGNVIVQGNNSTPANVVVNVAGDAFTVTRNAALLIRDLEIRTTTGVARALMAGTGGYIEFQNLRFGGVVGYDIVAMDSGHVVVTGNYSIVANSGGHYNAQAGGTIRDAATTVTLSGTPAFGIFANAQLGATLIAFSQTFSGSATGVRYAVASNGQIFTNGAGASYFPGSSAGSTSTGGQYV